MVKDYKETGLTSLTPSWLTGTDRMGVETSKGQRGEVYRGHGQSTGDAISKGQWSKKPD